MTLLQPLALALGVLAVPLIMLYILRFRRPDRVVSSSFLWHQSLEDIQANAPWQRLRPNLLLLLQLVALVALVLALAHPAYSQTRMFSGDLVIVVDQSPTMGATDVAPSRFAAALRAAHRYAADIASGSVVSVVGMAGQPHLMVAESSDRGAVDRAISSLHLASTSANFSAAFGLAESLARNGRSATVLVLTDRESGIQGPPTRVPFMLDIMRFGGRLHDIGISTFHAARQGSYTGAALSIHNFGTFAAASDLDLYADGQLADVRPLTLRPGQQQTLFWTDLPAGITRLQARLTARDDLAADKAAQVVVPADTSKHVLLVSTGDPWLQTALQLDSSVQLSTVLPRDYLSAGTQRFDLVVFDGVLPLQAPPTSLLIVGPPQGRIAGLRVGRPEPVATLSTAPMVSTDPLSRLLQYADLSDVHVSTTAALTLPPGLEPIVSSGSHPIVAAGRLAGRQAAVVGFDLHHSDWPLRVSYPVMMHNLLDYLAPNLTLSASTVTAGSTVGMTVPGDATQVQVIRPDGVADRLPLGTSTFADTSQPGFYVLREQLAGESRASVFAVNPSLARSAPSSGPQTLHFGRSQGGVQHGFRTHVDIAWAVALAGLVLLSVEWLYAWRR